MTYELVDFNEFTKLIENNPKKEEDLIDITVTESQEKPATELKIPADIFCNNCGTNKEFIMSERLYMCPICGEADVLYEIPGEFAKLTIKQTRNKQRNIMWEKICNDLGWDKQQPHSRFKD